MLSAKKLIIFGAGSFAKLAHYFFTHDSDYTVVAFTVDRAYLSDATFQGLPVIPFETLEQEFPPTEHYMFVALGIRQVNQIRAAKIAQVQAKHYRLASLVSSRAGVSPDLQILPNTMIMEGAGIHPFVKIGCNSMIFSATRIGFETQIGNHCWLVGAILGESVTVGDYSFIGLNATIAPGCSIGKSNIIGAGALILNSTKDGEVYKGHPSKAAKVPSSKLWQLT
ncbi:MAG: acetyltransferase [Cyanobacteria bacterium P01_G01_bin.67]